MLTTNRKAELFDEFESVILHYLERVTEDPCCMCGGGDCKNCSATKNEKVKKEIKNNKKTS